MSILKVIDQRAQPLTLGKVRGPKQTPDRIPLQSQVNPFSPLQGAPGGALQAAEEMPIQGSPFNQQRMQVGPRYNSISALVRMASREGTFRGAMPPDMVNVSWSDNPVPYEQSLNPPEWYTKQFEGKRTKRWVEKR